MSLFHQKRHELEVTPATLIVENSIEELDSELVAAPEDFFSYLGKHVSMRSNRALAFLTIFALDRFDYEMSLEEVFEDFKSFYNCRHPKTDFYQQLVNGTVEQYEELDVSIKQVLQHWDFSRISNSVKILLRMAMWELKYYKLTPFKTIIDEYVELSKLFAENDSYRIINGVLDKVAKEERTAAKEATAEAECQI